MSERAGRLGVEPIELPGSSVGDDGPTIAGAYIAQGQPAMVCYAKCWPCNFGDHYETPKWHTWADYEDIEHAANTGQTDPSKSRCGCYCAEVTA